MNTLLDSADFVLAGIKLFIPSSLILKKTFIRNAEPKHSLLSFFNRADPLFKDSILSIRRITNLDGPPSNKVELTLSSSRVPYNIFLSGWECGMTPVIPPPIRCFECQRFRHMAN